jgi:hypothetical protein
MMTFSLTLGRYTSKSPPGKTNTTAPDAKAFAALSQVMAFPKQQ